MVERALYQARKLHEFAQRAPDRLRVVRSADDLAAVLETRRTGKRLLAGVLGIEGTHALEGDLANLQLLPLVENVVVDQPQRRLGAHSLHSGERLLAHGRHRRLELIERRARRRNIVPSRRGIAFAL